MNFMDYCFITILLLSGFAGMYQGLARSVLGIASVFLTFFISISYDHKVAAYLRNETPIYRMLKNATSDTMNVSINSMPGMDKLTSLNDFVVNTIMSKIHVPPVLRRFIIEQVNIDITHINTANLIELASTKTADIFVNIMGFVLLFAALQLIFTILQNVLGVAFQLPILSEINAIGGLALGVIQGFITLYVICLAWSMLSGVQMYNEVFVDLNASKFAKVLYHNNILLDILVKYKII